MVSEKQVFKQVRDRVVPFLVEQARQEMMGVYKPGVVKPLGHASVSFLMSSSKPIRSIRGPQLPLTEFYALFKIYIPWTPTIDVPGEGDLLQEDVDYKIHLGGEGPIEKDKTLGIYSIDFWLTKEGMVWHEASSGLWKKAFKLLPETLQDEFIDMDVSLRLDHVF